MKKYYPNIQVLRGVMFLLILAFHSGLPYSEFGWGGVESFFVISSFFLVKKHFGNDMLSVKDQFKHRIARLYPPYIAVLFAAMLYASIKTIPYDFFVHLMSAQNMLWMFSEYKSAMQPLTAHTWTLSIEVWCGLIWLLMLKSLPKDAFKKMMWGMLAVGVVYRIITIQLEANAFVVSLCPIAHFDAFACGSILAIGFRENKINAKVSCLIALGLIGIISCIAFIAMNNQIDLIAAYKLLSSSSNYLNNWFTGNIYLFISLLTVGLVGLLILIDERNDANLGTLKRLFVMLGSSSYALYLFHWPILVVLKRFLGKGFLLFALTLIASIIVCFIFVRIYALLEMKLFRRV